MKIRIGLLLILLFAGAFLMTACHKTGRETEPVTPSGQTESSAPDQTDESSTEPPKEKSAVTLMIYMTGSDLESSSAAATKDLEEMLKSCPDLSKVNVVVYTGGSESWFSDIPTETNALLRLTPDGFQTEETFELLSMGDPQNLTRFLNYAEEHYPAERYDLILWDHGNGPLIGYGKDRIHQNDNMTLQELSEALQNSPFGPDNKLGFIGFDACLMASAELVCITGDYADYLVSSQETEPNFGWNYEALEGLDTLPTLEFTRQIVDKYINYCEDYFKDKAFFHSDVTLSIIDLSFAGALRDGLNALFKEAAEDVSGDYNKLAVERIRSRSLGRASTGSEYDLVDLRSLMESMAERYPEKTGAVLEILDSAVDTSGANAPECCGLSIYYPYYNKAYYNRSWRETYQDLSVFPDYLTYLERYEKIWLGTDLKELFEGQLVPRNGDDPHSYTLQLTEEQAEAYAAGQYYILRRIGSGLYTIMFVSDEVTQDEETLSASFDGRVIYFKNDYGREGIPLTRCGETVQGATDYTVIYAALQKRDPASGQTGLESVKYQLSLNHETGEVTIKDAYLETGEEGLETGKRKEIDFSQYEQFAFPELPSRYLTRNETGSIKSYWEWPTESAMRWYILSVTDGLYFTYEPLYDDGYEYYLMFEIQDVQGGHYSSELIPVFLDEASESEVPVEEHLWKNEESIVIGDSDGLKAELQFFREEKTGDLLTGLYVKNDSPDEIWFECDRIILNESVLLDQTIFESLEPGQETFSWIADQHAISQYWGESLPDTMSFEIEAQKRLYFGTVIRKKQISIIFPEENEISMDTLPEESYTIGDYDLPDLSRTRMTFYRGARAKDQILLDNDRVKVRLHALGKLPYAGYDHLTAVLEVENKLDEELYFDVKGIQINGVETNGILSADPLGIPGGLTCYYLVNYSESNSYTSDAEPPFTGGVNSVSLSVSAHKGKVDLGGTWCPVRLTEAAKEVYEPERGTLVFEEEGIRVELRAVREAFAYSGGAAKNYTWYLTMVNDTDDDAEISFRDVCINGQAYKDYLLPYPNKVCAHSLCYSRIELSSLDDTALPVLSFIPRFIFHGRAEMYIQSEKSAEIRPDMLPEEKEPLVYRWEGQSSMLLWEESGLRAELLLYQNKKDGSMMAALQTTNQNAHGTVVLRRNMIYDGEVPVERSSWDQSGEIPGGGQTQQWFTDLAAVACYRGEVIPASLSFTVEAINKETSGIMIHGRRVLIDFTGGSEADLRALPVHEAVQDLSSLPVFSPEEGLRPIHEALAGEQTLLDNDQVRVRLIGLGREPGLSDRICAVIEVENKTNDTIPVRWTGISVNGVFADCDQNRTLAAGMTCYLDEYLSSMDYPDLAGIHDISILLVTDISEITGYGMAGGTWYPVSLKEASDTIYEPETGTIVFDEEGVQIGIVGFEESDYYGLKDKIRYRWTLAIVNRTDRHIQIEMENECLNGKPVERGDVYSGPSLYNNYAGSHTVRYATVELVVETGKPKPEKLSFTVNIGPMGAPSSQNLYVSDTAIELALK